MKGQRKMKQVIVRIKNCRATYSKTIAKMYCYSVAQFEEQIIDFCKELLPHQEIEISVGRQYITYLSYEDICDYAKYNEQDFDAQLYDSLIDDYALRYEIRQYLPRY